MPLDSPAVGTLSARLQQTGLHPADGKGDFQVTLQTICTHLQLQVVFSVGPAPERFLEEDAASLCQEKILYPSEFGACRRETCQVWKTRYGTTTTTSRTSTSHHAI